MTIDLINRAMSRGLKSTFQSALSVIEDSVFDIRHRLDTRAEVAVEDLDIGEDDKLQAEKYKPTRARYFRKLMRQIRLPRDGIFVDVGCGKGRVLMLAAEQGFDRIVGLEISAHLCELAKKNIDRFRPRYADGQSISVVCDNVVHYSLTHEETVFFLYSPFERDLTHQFLGKVRESLRRNPRQLFLVINEFRFPDLLENDELLLHAFSYTYGAADFDVYESRVS